MEDKHLALADEFRTRIAEFFTRRTDEPFVAAMSVGSTLSEAEEGRYALRALLADPNPFVRAHAAGYVIEFDEARARGVLESLVETDSPAKAQAQMILAEPFDEAELDAEVPPVQPSAE